MPLGGLDQQAAPAGQLQAPPPGGQAGQGSQLRGQADVLGGRLLPQLCTRQQQLHASQCSLERGCYWQLWTTTELLSSAHSIMMFS